VSLAIVVVEQKGEISPTEKDRITTARSQMQRVGNSSLARQANSRVRKPWRLDGRCGARLFGRAAERPLIEAFSV
jgi:hypothetical protein